MYTQTCSRPLNIPTIIREININSSSQASKATPIKVFPYIELYHLRSQKTTQFSITSNNQSSLITNLNKKRNKIDKIYNHDLSYKNQSIKLVRNTFIGKAKSEIEQVKHSRVQHYRSLSDSEKTGRFTQGAEVNLMILPVVNKAVKIGSKRKESLPDYPVNLHKIDIPYVKSSLKNTYSPDSHLETKDASINT